MSITTFSWYDIFRYPFNQHGIREGISFIKHGFQRMFRGYDDTAYWGLYHYIARIALPVLRHYKAQKTGVPAGLGLDYPNMTFSNQRRKWESILGKMITSFELILDDEYYSLNTKERKKHSKQVTEGLELFAKYYENLWE